jgi:hypothetical protein
MKGHEDKYMAEHDERQIRDALKQSFPQSRLSFERICGQTFCANSTITPFVCPGMTGPWLA